MSCAPKPYIYFLFNFRKSFKNELGQLPKKIVGPQVILFLERERERENLMRHA